MNSLFQKAYSFAKDRPFFTVTLTATALLAYANIFIFGYLLAIPKALRPFLDAQFYSNLAFEFFMSLAVSSVLARSVVLVSRYALSSNLFQVQLNLPNILILSLSLLSDQFPKIQETDRRTRVQLRLIARWVRQKKIAITVILSFIIFSIIYLGWHAIWFLTLSVVSIPVLWTLVSSVELRRVFATTRNTKSMSTSRLIAAFASFAAIYLAICTVLAGIAIFQQKLDTRVSIGVDQNTRETSLLAVTSTGMLVGNHSAASNRLISPFSISAYFLPYSFVESVGQRH